LGDKKKETFTERMVEWLAIIAVPAIRITEYAVIGTHRYD